MLSCWLCNIEHICKPSVSFPQTPQSIKYHLTVWTKAKYVGKAFFMHFFQHFHQVLVFKLAILQSLVCFFQLFQLRKNFYRVLTSYNFFSVLSSGNLFRPVSLLLNIKHCSGYVTVSFSVLFQINYASVWHHRFGAKTNSPLSFFGCTGGDSGECSLMLNKLSKGKGTASQNSQVFPWQIQIYSNSLAWS